MRRDAPAMAVAWCQLGVRTANVCCAASCGTCEETACSERPGGRERCCPRVIGRSRPVCRHLSEVACRLPKEGNWTVQVPVWAPLRATTILPRCTDRSAYVTLLNQHHHASAARSTFLTRVDGDGKQPKMLLSQRMRKQLHLVLVLVRSLRRAEAHCLRDFVVLLGTGVLLTPRSRSALERELTTFVEVPPILPGIPAADKLHAWKLSNYTRCLLVDADILILRSVDELFARGAPSFVMAHHPTDLIQAECGLSPPRRGVSAFVMMQPSPGLFTQLVASLRGYSRYHLEHYSEQTTVSPNLGHQAAITAAVSDAVSDVPCLITETACHHCCRV